MRPSEKLLELRESFSFPHTPLPSTCISAENNTRNNKKFLLEGGRQVMQFPPPPPQPILPWTGAHAEGFMKVTYV